MNYFGIDRIYNRYRFHLHARAREVWKTGKVLLGDRLFEFENSIKERVDRNYAVGVGSATDGIYFTLKAYGIDHTKKVICPALSYTATRDAILRTGAQIIFVDTDEKGRLKLDNLPKADAAVYVNLYGNPLNYYELKRQCNLVIEDAAQSMGASFDNIPSGKLGDTSIFSFDPTKNLPCFGSGGMVLTDHIDVAEDIVKFRKGYYNSVLPEDHASQLNYLLQFFDEFQMRRNEVAETYYDLLPDARFIKPDSNTKGAYQKLVILTDQKLKLKKHYNQTLDPSNEYPNADYITKKCYSLPIHPFMKTKEIKEICSYIQS